MARYRKKNGLFIPSDGPPPSYEEAHWGRAPRDRHHTMVQEPRDNARLIGLGSLMSVVYVTEKGRDTEPVEYDHRFKESEMPLLAYGSHDGYLYILGGGYRIEKHGIIG
jgi:hypothetical protein